MTQTRSGTRHPWARLTPALARLLRPSLPDIVTEIVGAISAEVPAYRGALADEIGPTVRRGVELALTRLLELFGTDDPALDRRAQDFYERIGAGEDDLGRSLEALLSAYRTGARVSWEHMSATAVAAGVATDDLVVLAESIFVYIDELSGASAQGHARALAGRSGYREVVRSQLAHALLEGAAASGPGRLAALSEAAAWPIPELLAVAVVPRRIGSAGPSLPTAPSDVLVIERESDALVVIPDPTGRGRRQRLTEGVRGPVFVGTVRTPAAAAVSLDHAVRLRDLARLGQVPDDRIVLAVDHLPSLLISADPVVAGEWHRRALRPLDAVLPGKRPALMATLGAWLDLQGDRGAVAQALVVHPQTVSYRMNRLRELFGAVLDDPDGRFGLQLALRSGGWG